MQMGGAVCSASTLLFSSHFALFLLLLLLLHVSQQVCSSSSAFSRSQVKFLPGFQGPLPFHLETGYVGVGESEDVHLFYYFIKSERSPKHDPLVLWLTGGPGYSDLYALAFEIGPFAFKKEEYNGSVPSLVLNPHSWTKVSSIIFVDLPVNTGFSYTKLPATTERSDYKQVEHALQFMRKWLIHHPEYLSNTFYIAGDSYSGFIVPPLALEILKGNENNVQPSINYQGYLLGNPKTDVVEDQNARVPFSHGMGLISDELYELVSGLYKGHILEPSCPTYSLNPQQHSGARSLGELSEFSFVSEPSLPTIECRNYEDLLAYYWANDNMVRKALGIRQGSVGTWQVRIESPYTYEIKSSIQFHEKLGNKGYRSLIYSGDHDIIVPFCGTEAWIRSLNYSVVDEWRQWLVQGQVAGYTREYSNGMTFATIKGGGHTAPEYKPRECFTMFERWISKKPL